MKIDNYLLTEQDINNIKLKEKIDLEIQEKIQIEYERIANECVEKYGNINYNELKNSDDLKYKLTRKYKHYEDISSAFILGTIFLLGSVILPTGNILTNQPLGAHKIIASLGMFIGSIFILYLGTDAFLIRRKIKKNFKELGIGDEL